METSMIQKSTVEQKIAQGYEFRFGDYLSQGFEIFKKEWLTFSLYALASFFITLLSAITLIGPLFVALPLAMGYVIGAHKVQKGEPLALGDMFGGFDKMWPLAKLMLLVVGVMLVATLPFGGVIGGMAAAAESGSEAAGGAAAGAMMLMYLVIFVVAIALSLALFFAPYLIFWGNYSTREAIKTSWNLAKKQWLMIIIWAIVLGVIQQIGMYLCVIGMFPAMAFTYVSYYPILRDILMDDPIDAFDTNYPTPSQDI